MFCTAVRYCRSTMMKPRAFTPTPISSRPSAADAPDATGAVEHAVGGQLVLADRHSDTVLVHGHVRDVGVDVDRDAQARRHLLAQRVADLGVEVREQPARGSSRASRARRVRRRCTRTRSRSRRRRPRPSTRECARAEQGVAVEDHGAVDRDALGLLGMRARRDQEDLAADRARRLAEARHLDGLRGRRSARCPAPA